jgi:hypothetical protein
MPLPAETYGRAPYCPDLVQKALRGEPLPPPKF